MPSNHHETFFHPMRALPHNPAPTSSNADEREPQGSKRSCHTSHQSDTDHQPPGADLALRGRADATQPVAGKTAHRPALRGSAQEGGRHRRRHKRRGPCTRDVRGPHQQEPSRRTVRTAPQNGFHRGDLSAIRSDEPGLLRRRAEARGDEFLVFVGCEVADP